MSLKEGDVKTHGEDVTCAPRRDLSALSTSCKGRASIQWKHRSTMLHSGLSLQSEFVVPDTVHTKDPSEPKGPYVATPLATSTGKCLYFSQKHLGEDRPKTQRKP